MGIFYLGLSYVSNQDSKHLKPQSPGILRELDRRAGKNRVWGSGPEGDAENPGEGPLILTEGGGRPYFADGHADFSVSHSKGMMAVSYLGSPSADRRFRTGCDIQYQHPKRAYREIAAHFFHPLEREVLTEDGAGDEGLRAFYRLWVLKEAYLKIRGLSVFDLCRCPVFIIGGQAGEKIPSGESRDGGEPGEGYFFPKKSGDGRDELLEFLLYETRGPAGDAYSLAVCRERDGGNSPTEPELRWFSPEKLPLESIAKLNRLPSLQDTAYPAGGGEIRPAHYL
ncbi:MAG: 4'-phosphopantetheinyl transferase superfamily protein [Spirochaetaceae bacterium]|jgi:hypothetical protein|nr:4'-phosphopantetheinyl transferase superfamily protein [Spirochaetaceae bacterium]